MIPIMSIIVRCRLSLIDCFYCSNLILLDDRHKLNQKSPPPIRRELLALYAIFDITIIPRLPAKTAQKVRKNLAKNTQKTRKDFRLRVIHSFPEIRSQGFAVLHPPLETSSARACGCPPVRDTGSCARCSLSLVPPDTIAPRP